MAKGKSKFANGIGQSLKAQLQAAVDKNFGDDSPLYAALGYISRSRRSSGLTRKNAEAPAPVVRVAS